MLHPMARKALSGDGLESKARRQEPGAPTAKDRSAAFIGRSLEDLVAAAEAAKFHWDAGDSEEALKALDDLASGAKGLRTKMVGHGESYQSSDTEEVIEGQESKHLAGKGLREEEYETQWAGLDSSFETLQGAVADLGEAINLADVEYGLEALAEAEGSLRDCGQGLRYLAANPRGDDA